MRRIITFLESKKDGRTNYVLQNLEEFIETVKEVDAFLNNPNPFSQMDEEEITERLWEAANECKSKDPYIHGLLSGIALFIESEVLR